MGGVFVEPERPGARCPSSCIVPTPFMSGEGVKTLDVEVVLLPVRGRLVIAAHDQRPAVGQQHVRGVPAAVAHAGLLAPGLVEGVEREDLVQALPVGLIVEVAARDEYATVGQQRLRPAPDVGRLADPVDRVDEVRRIDPLEGVTRRVPQVRHRGVRRRGVAEARIGVLRVGEHQDFARRQHRHVDGHHRQRGGGRIPAPDLALGPRLGGLRAQRASGGGRPRRACSKHAPPLGRRQRPKPPPRARLARQPPADGGAAARVLRGVLGAEHPLLEGPQALFGHSRDAELAALSGVPERGRGRCAGQRSKRENARQPQSACARARFASRRLPRHDALLHRRAALAAHVAHDPRRSAAQRAQNASHSACDFKRHIRRRPAS